MMIPGGLTSIMQPCDLVVNKELKALAKRWYSAWRLAELERMDAEGARGHVKLKMPRADIMKAMVDIVAKINLDAKQMKSVVDCFVKCGFALTSSVPDEVLDGEKWMDHLPEFKAWIASLSEKTLYKHLLESLNVAAESDEGTGLIEQLSESDLASAVDGFDAHLADALADFEEDSHSSSEEDLDNGPVL